MWCASHSAHSFSGASILWYHWVLELLSKERLLCVCAVWPCRSTGQGQWHGLTGKGTRHQAYWPEFYLKDPLGGRSELYLQIIVWILNMCSDGIHIHAITLHIHIHTYTCTAHSYTCRTYTRIYTHMYIHRHVHIIKMYTVMYDFSASPFIIDFLF